jgi:AcrR family transcriptional regulator
VPERPIRPALQERYDRRREAMVSTAAAVFARQGYDQTTMQDLARSMGLATGALYHYFGSKEHLLMAICDALHEPMLARAREVSLSDDPPSERIRTIVRTWVGHVLEYRDHMLVFQQERHVIESGPKWRDIRTTRKAFERLIGDALLEAQSEEPRTGDRRLELGALLGMVNHTPTWYRPNGPLQPDDIADGYLALLIGPQRPR